MIIETRYRDIPWEEACKCSTGSSTHDKYRPVRESMRGQPVVILTPPRACTETDYLICGGPFYELAVNSHKYDPETGVRGIGCVCPHIAEIGD